MMKKFSKTKIILLTIAFFSFFGLIKNTHAASPVLNFSDLIDGPRSGLNDNLGEGVIVTVWGNNLINGTFDSSTHKIYVGSEQNGWTEVAYVYYWKNADGQLPSGPSDLYTSHGMQEIAFSLSISTATGAQYIRITNDEGLSYSNTLPFYVRTTGRIFFVNLNVSGSSDSNPGTWESPWSTVTKNFTEVGEGGIVYVVSAAKNEVEIGASGGNDIDGSENNRCAIVAYPGSAIIADTMSTYWSASQYWIYSKFRVNTNNDCGIELSGYGRTVGNEIFGTGGSNDGQSAAIDGGANDGPDHDYISAARILGNYIHDWGNSSTSNLEHTMYLKVRYNMAIPGVDIGWNRLENNRARSGLYWYDEGNTTCGRLSSPAYVHDNWVKNQAGGGIQIGSVYDYGATFMTGTWYIYNNVLINCGLQYDQGINAQGYAVYLYGGVNRFDIYLYNNTIYGYGDSTNPDGDSVAINVPSDSYNWPFGGRWYWYNNLVVDTKNLPFSHKEYDSGDFKSPNGRGNNLWYNGGDGNPSGAPSWDVASITDNPMLVSPESGNFQLQFESPAINSGSFLVQAAVLRDFRGVIRPQGAGFDMGAFEYISGEIDAISPFAPVGLGVK